MSSIYRSDAAAQQISERYRDHLATWPIPCEHRRIPTREGETFVVVSGPPDGPPLVLLHGSGANTSTWKGDIAAWSGRFRTYAIDLIGEPGFSAPSRPVLDSDEHARWLDEVLDGLGVEAAAVIGMSLGGWVALDYAIRRPGRVLRLALLCPGGIGRQTPGRLFGAMLTIPFGQWGRRRSVVRVTGLADPAYAPLLDELTRTFGLFEPRTERLPVFPDRMIGAVTVPVLVIVGARDVMFDSSETAERAQRGFPDVRVHVLPGVGHAVLGQTDRILEFLDEAAR